MSASRDVLSKLTSIARSRRGFALGLGALLALGACGKKGDLERPPAPEPLIDDQPDGLAR